MITDLNCPSTSSLEQLPNEILDSIFFNLDIKSLCHVRLVSVRLKNVVTHSSKISEIFPRCDVSLLLFYIKNLITYDLLFIYKNFIFLI